MTVDISQIKQMLAQDAIGVCRYLLPGGKEESGEWRCGSVDGEAGKSLGVHLRGQKAGVWSDFNGGASGDLIDLWCAARGIPLSQALDEAKKWLGIQAPKVKVKARDFKQPARPNCRPPEARVKDYLVEVRNIPEASLAAYKIGEQGNRIIFPFLRPDGTLAMVKARNAEDGAKSIPTEGGCEQILFGWQAIGESAREVTICEGEADAPSLHAYGFPALSVPLGAGKGGKQNWIESDFERLQRFETIYLATDNDGPGDIAADDIAERLGRHRCYRVKLPRKDANECRMDGVPQSEIQAAFDAATSLDPHGLRLPMELLGDVVKIFWPEPGQHVGYQTPYWKLRDKLLFQPGDVTVWTGATGAGKSQILSDCMVDTIRQGSRICISSLEMQGSRTLARMVRQVTGVAKPTEIFIKQAVMWVTGGLVIYDYVGKSKIENILEIFEYCRAKYGCDQFVLDSLMRLGIAGDDYSGQEKAAFSFVNWAMDKKVHGHFVAHARKGGSSDGAPEAEDIKGGMEIGGNAPNIVSVWRNRARDDALKLGEHNGKKLSDEEIAELEEKAGVIFNVAKQRNGDFEGKISLWFDQESYRYYCSNRFTPLDRQYLNIGNNS